MPIPTEEALLVLLPAFFRVGGMLLSSPVFHAGRVPLPVRVALALVITIATWPALEGQRTPAVDGLAALALLAGQEALVGIAIGLAATLVFAAIEYAGQVVGVSIGLAIVNVLDPISNAQVSIISRLYSLFALVIFFAIDAHHLLIHAIVRSFRVLPIGEASLGIGGASALVALGGDIFSTGVQIAAPVLAVMLITEIAMGLVVRTVPQMNIFIVGFPLKIGLGFFLISLTLPHLVRVLHGLFSTLDRTFGSLLGGM